MGSAVSPPAIARPAPWPVRRRWLASPRDRWLLRGAIALPLALVGIVVHARVGESPPNALLLTRGHAARSGGFDGIGAAYPPIPTFVASLARDGILLTIVGCASAAIGGVVVLERLVARMLPPPLIVLLFASVSLLPSTWYLFTGDVAGQLGVMLLIVALDGFERFVIEGETLGGFTTGIALGLAVLCDPAAIVYAIALTVAAPLTAAARYRRVHGALSATSLVFGFPAAAALASWAFVEWRFTGSAFNTLSADLDLFTWPDGFGTTLLDLLERLGGVVLHVPVYVATTVVLALRRPVPMVLGFALPLVLLLVGWVIGLDYPDYVAVTLLATLGAMGIPDRTTRGDRALVAVAAVGQLLVGAVWLTDEAIVRPWLDALR